MANKGTWPADTSLAGSAEDAINANRTTGDNLWIGIDGLPTGGSLLNGVRYWKGGISGSSYTLAAYVNATEVELFAADATLGGPKLTTDLFCNDKQLQSALLHAIATGSLPTTAQRVWYDSTLKLLGFSDGTDRWYASRYKIGGTSLRSIPCDLNVTTLGTPATASTATILGGWLLDATAEQLNVVAKEAVPVGYTGAHDCQLAVDVILAAAETANDDIDHNGVIRSVRAGEGPGKSSTAMTALDENKSAGSYDIGPDNAQYDRHRVYFSIDYDDATNPVAAGDYLAATINLATITGVAGIVVVGAEYLIPCWDGRDEQD